MSMSGIGTDANVRYWYQNQYQVSVLTLESGIDTDTSVRQLVFGMHTSVRYWQSVPIAMLGFRTQTSVMYW